MMSRGVFTTINSNGDNLLLHYYRLVNASNDFEIPFKLSFESFKEKINSVIVSTKHTGIKVIVNEIGEMTIEERDYNLAKDNYSLKTEVQVESDAPKYKLYPNDNTINELRKINMQGFDDKLFIVNNLVSETLIANIWLIKDDKLFTSKITNNILPGTVRAQLLQLYNSVEEDINLEMLMNADIVFVTNSIKVIQIVTNIDGIKLSINEDTLKDLDDIRQQLIIN